MPDEVSLTAGKRVQKGLVSEDSSHFALAHVLTRLEC